jgi:hypothetical protein
LLIKIAQRRPCWFSINDQKSTLNYFVLAQHCGSAPSQTRDAAEPQCFVRGTPHSKLLIVSIF